MAQAHGAEMIKAWLEDFAQVARSGERFDTSAGANPGRDYAYLEYHQGDERHSILLFRVEEKGGSPTVQAYRFDGNAVEVRERVDQLTHAERSGER